MIHLNTNTYIKGSAVLTLGCNSAQSSPQSVVAVRGERRRSPAMQTVTGTPVRSSPYYAGGRLSPDTTHGGIAPEWVGAWVGGGE